MSRLEETQISQNYPPKKYLGSPKLVAVAPYNSQGRRLLTYLGSPITAPRGPGIQRGTS